MKLRSLGDTVLMTACLEELKRAYPEAQLHVAVSARWAPLFESYPGIHKVWTYERHKDPAARAKAVARIALNLRREKFDCVVNFHASPSSAMIAFATGARVRSIHFHGHKQKNKHSTVEVPGKGTLKPITERDMDTVRALGIHVPSGRMPAIHLRAVEIDRAKEWLGKSGATGPVLGIGLGASRPSKSWPLDRFAALAVNWCQQTGGSAIAFSGPEDKGKQEELLKSVDDLLSATIPDTEARASVRSRILTQVGLPLRSLAAVQHQLSVFAGNDSGPRHLAVAVGIPTVTVFGPEHPFEWHPYPTDRHPFFFLENLPCRKDGAPGMPPWCGLEECVSEQHQCMRMIGVDAVLEGCLKFAKGKSA